MIGLKKVIFQLFLFISVLKAVPMWSEHRESPEQVGREESSHHFGYDQSNNTARQEGGVGFSVEKDLSEDDRGGEELAVDSVSFTDRTDQTSYGNGSSRNRAVASRFAHSAEGEMGQMKLRGGEKFPLHSKSAWRTERTEAFKIVPAADGAIPSLESVLSCQLLQQAAVDYRAGCFDFSSLNPAQRHALFLGAREHLKFIGKKVEFLTAEYGERAGVKELIKLLKEYQENCEKILETAESQNDLLRVLRNFMTLESEEQCEVLENFKMAAHDPALPFVVRDFEGVAEKFQDEVISPYEHLVKEFLEAVVDKNPPDFVTACRSYTGICSVRSFPSWLASGAILEKRNYALKQQKESVSQLMIVTDVWKNAADQYSYAVNKYIKPQYHSDGVRLRAGGDNHVKAARILEKVVSQLRLRGDIDLEQWEKRKKLDDQKAELIAPTHETVERSGIEYYSLPTKMTIQASLRSLLPGLSFLERKHLFYQLQLAEFFSGAGHRWYYDIDFGGKVLPRFQKKLELFESRYDGLTDDDVEAVEKEYRNFVPAENVRSFLARHYLDELILEIALINKQKEIKWFLPFLRETAQNCIEYLNVYLPNRENPFISDNQRSLAASQCARSIDATLLAAQALTAGEFSRFQLHLLEADCYKKLCDDLIAYLKSNPWIIVDKDSGSHQLPQWVREGREELVSEYKILLQRISFEKLGGHSVSEILLQVLRTHKAELDQRLQDFKRREKSSCVIS